MRPARHAYEIGAGLQRREELLIEDPGRLRSDGRAVDHKVGVLRKLEQLIGQAHVTHVLGTGAARSTVTADLIAALKSGRLAGAGLDVVDPEPLPADSPLWHLPNVIITPHISADTPLAEEQRNAVTIENLRRYAAGEPMLSVVNVERGY
jgi:hypothetical protein